MPRPRKPFWHDRDRCYKTRIDGREVTLRSRDGTKVAADDQRGVREAVARLLAERDATVRRVADPTVEDVCSQYLIACARECTHETMVGKEWRLRQWCEFGAPPYGGRPTHSIEAVDLHRMGRQWKHDGYASGTIRALYHEVMACWAWATRPEPERQPVKILEDNPLAGLRVPGLSPRTAKYLPMAAARKLIAFAAARAEGITRPIMRRFELQAVLMLRLIAETGCRPKEACRARWRDLDADQGLLVLKEHKTARKTGRDRLIVIPPAILAELLALRESGHAHPAYLFAHKRTHGENSRGAAKETGAPWTRPGYTCWFRLLVRAARKAKLELPEGVTLYWLRHSYLTDAQIAVGAERAADLAGNSKELARGTYLHVQAEELRRQQEEVAARRV